MLVIGLTAKPCAGKGTISQALQDAITDMNNPPSLFTPRFSDTPREILQEIGLENSRENLQVAVQIMEKAGIAAGVGPGLLSRCVKKRVIEMTDNVTGLILVIVDGVRWPTDEEMIRSFPNNIIIGVTASIQTRYRRAVARSENSGDASKSFEEFTKEDTAPNETFIPKIIDKADFVIDNDNRPLDDLRSEINTLWKKQLMTKML